MAQLTQEQLEALIAMQDIGGMEDEQSRMMNMAQGLRQAGMGTRGTDTGSNIGRAAYGIAGAMGDYKAGKMAPGISSGRQGIMSQLMRGMKKPVSSTGAPSPFNPQDDHVYE